ncbi:MAG TPA: cobaltochelatase subunit CobN [Streptosporangiaceae bacterium]
MIALFSTADTELLAARQAGFRVANPSRVEPGDLDRLLDGVQVVVVRLLGGVAAWEDGLAALRARGVPLVALGGEAAPDAGLMAHSTVPAGLATQALAYLAEGGVRNLRALHAFLSDTILLTGEAFPPPEPMPAYGVHERPAPGAGPGRPVVAVVYYRAHELAGNTAFVDALCDAVEDAGAAPLPVFCASLRDPDDGLVDLLRAADAIVVTVLAAGGVAGAASGASAGGDDEAWDAGALAALDVPLIQGLCLTTSRAVWAESTAALSPMDAATQVAVPEFDGRLISVPFSFKEPGPDGVPVYRADPERAARVAGIAAAHARLRHTPPEQRRLAIMLSSYPTKHARVGNAVGLDTPASAVRLLAALRDAGYTVADHPEDGDTLIHTLIAAGGHDVEWLTEEQLAAADVRVPASAYGRWFGELPEALRERVRAHWGDPPGELYVDDQGGEPAIVVAALRYGNVVLMIQPPRGFGENPVAIYHDPDLPPSHHYLAAYRWLEREFGAHAVVHLGKHGTLEWLPGKGLGLAADSAPDAALGNLPLVYPFIVNDPGEGTQAKRRGHAAVVDHLVPPMARADTYGDLAKLEQALDEYAQVADLDPDKLPAVREQIWDLVRTAELHHDLSVDAPPDAAEFDDFVLHIDGYLCEIKDVQIRDGLHILGQIPEGEPRVNLLLAILRASQIWGGRTGAVPGLRAALSTAYALDEQTLLTEPGAPATIPAELVRVAGGAHTPDPPPEGHLRTPPSPPAPTEGEARTPLSSSAPTENPPEVAEEGSASRAPGTPPEGEARTPSPAPSGNPPVVAGRASAAASPGAPAAISAKLAEAEAGGEEGPAPVEPPPVVAGGGSGSGVPAGPPLSGDRGPGTAEIPPELTRAADGGSASRASGAAAGGAPAGGGERAPGGAAQRGGAEGDARDGGEAALASIPAELARAEAGGGESHAPAAPAEDPRRGDGGDGGDGENPRTPLPARTASDAVDLVEAVARRLVAGMEERGWAAGAVDGVCAEVLGRDVPDVVRVLEFAAAEVVPRLDGTGREIGAIVHALGGGFVPPGPSGSPTRGLVNVLPTGRNFYSVDPKAIPSRNSWDTGRALADSLLARHLADTGAYPASVGLTVWGTAAMRTQGDDIAEALALLGCRPVWDDASRRVTGFAIVPAAELARPRVDVTLRISGFFRDAFPHVITLLDDAVRAVADLDEAPEYNYVRAHALADHDGHGDWRRATTRIFGSAPGAYGAGLLPLIDARNWRDDADLARVYEVWGGYAYGRGLDGRDARADMRASFARISVAVKNQDTREHDIVDSDDYFQYHGGMIAMVRTLTGAAPAAYVGDSAVPDAVRTRTLGEETRRVFRARVVNPRWIAAMRRHGYKGAFELAATVDYLFGYDATAGVVDDWMYEKLAEAYVFDPETRDFVARSNPWALRGMTERLLEAADRGLWARPDPATLDRLRDTYLSLEGDLEGADPD